VYVMWEFTDFWGNPRSSRSSLFTDLNPSVGEKNCSYFQVTDDLSE